MANIAQTNLQLLNQMLLSGYALEDIEKVAQAYYLATEVFNCQYRGSGKPLLSHLVGVASILVAINRPPKSIIAGLLHAAPGDGDFGTSTSSKVVSERCGLEVNGLIDTYIKLEYSYSGMQLSRFSQNISGLTTDQKEAIIIRIANEIEDYVDGALKFYSVEGKKGYRWRINYVSVTFPEISNLARLLGQSELAGMVDKIFNDCQLTLLPCEPSIPDGSSIRNRGKMYFLKPLSMRFRFTVLISKICRKVLRTLRWR